MVEIAGLTLVVDSGPDFRQQMLRENVKKLDAILYTHEHKDHIAGLDDVRAFNFVFQKPVDLYLEERVGGAIRREFPYVFDEYKYPGVPEINLHTIENKPFEIKGVKVIPVRAYHYRLPVFGFRIGDFTYITDANYIPGEEKKKIAGSRYITLNALRREKHVSHFTLSEALDIFKEFRPERGYITHVSHQMGLYSDIQRELPSGVMLAYDGLQVMCCC